MARSDAPKEPVDTTGDPVLEAKWQALVQGVIDAKAEAATKRDAWAEACDARGPLHTATPEGVAAAEDAKAEYDAALQAVLDAGARMKAGDL